ncbi:hypothetical protein BTN49_2739 [Candidatus Enterovibrio escicola]|uniref:Uncharacterized protein n=1 Tax=Candidatus Enterovibrio escicola TaxID=1927127 RepID=A0A2A5T0N5_9GAMM|nr:hypothetical protein BTN49_2739 [Candidatus Enterovibrio escacola]
MKPYQKGITPSIASVNSPYGRESVCQLRRYIPREIYLSN